MACNHKFINDLNLENVGFQPEILIIGTFNPSWPENNLANWFYGRTHDINGNMNNNFWDVLPRIFDQDTLINETEIEWKYFCKMNKVAITDLITSIDDADENNHEHVQWLGGYADNVIAENFHDFQFTNVLQILEQNPCIKKVYITNGVNGTFWTNLWNPIVAYCQENNIISQKLLTPSKNARFSMFAWNRQNQQNQYGMHNLNDFILMKWEQVF